MPTANKTKPQKAGVKKLIDRLEKSHPEAKLDLHFTNPLELLIALILAAQARDDLVNQVTAVIFRKYRTAEEYVRSPTAVLEDDIRKINFFRTKARSIHNCCDEIVKRFDGKVPGELKDLVKLPGVGRKTANIVLGNAFGKDTIGVDTHVMRLSQRLGLTTNSDPEKIEADLMPLVPETRRVRFCHLLQYHGRGVCLAKRPRCPQCSVRSLCPYREKTV